MVSTMHSVSVYHRASPRPEINLRRGRRSVHAVKDAGLLAGRQLGLFCLALLACAADAEECYCDRWFSTNTRTLDYPTPRRSRMVTSGMSYSGPKSTTLNGVGCLPWKEVFDACSEGFEQMQIQLLANGQGSESGLRYDHDSELMLSVVLAKMIPDGLGMLGGVSPPGPFDDANNPLDGHWWCRASNQALLLHPSLATTGPFCFVDATDPRALNFTRANGWLGGVFGANFHRVCPEVTPVPCGVPRCSPDVVDNESTQCARGAAVDSSSTRARLLLANGKFELWARRTNRNGIVREVSLSRDPPNSWAAVTYKKYPPLVEGANPAEPRFWDLCLYSANDVEALNIGYNASTDGVEMGHLLHKFGALVRCDAVVPRVEGISLSEHSPGRGGSASAARMEFVKANDTAALKAENGAVAALAPNVVHVAKAWVRCVRGAATVALVVSSLPVMDHVSGLPSSFEGSGVDEAL